MRTTGGISHAEPGDQEPCVKAHEQGNRGHGLNTGIGDAVDLGWKLAATLAGWAGPGILDSYEAERRPLHRRVIDEAATNMATLAPELLSDDLDRDDATGRMARQRAAVRIKETKSAEYFSLDLVLGHRYQESPVIPKVTECPRNWRVHAAPGRRLPHAWVAPGVSTLDAVGAGHTALVRRGSDTAELKQSAARAGLPLQIVPIDGQSLEVLGAEAVVIRPDQVVAGCGEQSSLAADDFMATLTGARS